MRECYHPNIGGNYHQLSPDGKLEILFFLKEYLAMSNKFSSIANMKTLIIHPQDSTTAFLTGIYKDLSNKTVITGGLTKKDLLKDIHDHDRVLMMGHGSPAGLFSVAQFDDTNYIIDASMIESLQKKNNNIFIWCYADHFVKRNNLKGFATGMFISEPSEALYMGYGYVGNEIIDKSNYTFSSIVAKYLNEPLDVLYENVIKEYGVLAKTNPIAKYNIERLYLSQSQPVLLPNKFA